LVARALVVARLRHQYRPSLAQEKTTAADAAVRGVHAAPEESDADVQLDGQLCSDETALSLMTNSVKILTSTWPMVSIVVKKRLS
jgi:hypothetical protein